MKKFTFRLQRILDIRQTVEESKRRDFLAANGEYRKAVKILTDYVELLTRYQEELYRLGEKGVDILLVQFYYRYFASLEKQISYQKKLIEIAREEMEKRREILVEAVKERRKFERLKEKKYEQYRIDSEIEEQKISDEISGGKFFQKEKLQNSPSVQGVV